MSGTLEGIKVLDLSRVLAGPWASQLLADYGAGVIKIERPHSGDDTRRWGPPWLRDKQGGDTGESAYFLSTNRNKRSVTADFAHPDGQALIRSLALKSDVVLENFKVGTLARYGLDAEALRAGNERLVYCSISAFGQTGSRSQEAGYDAMIQAAGGLMSITGEDAKQGGSPLKVGVAISDIMTGMYAASAILAALLRRETTGKGECIDVSLYDSQVAWLANQSMNYLVGGEVPPRLGNAHPNIVPYQSFATSDGHLMLAIGNDAQFAACAECIGLGNLGEDVRFATNAARVNNRQELIRLLQDRFSKDKTAHWIQVLTDLHIPVSCINDLADVYSGDYCEERETVRHLPHPLAGETPTVANPVRFSEAAVEYHRAPPLLGQHTDEVLREELGYTDEQIRALRESAAV